MRDNLGQLLRDGTSQLTRDLTPAPAHLVRARGSQRSRRKAAGTTALAVALIVAGGGGAYALSQQPHAAPGVVAPVTPTPSATTAPAMVITVCTDPAVPCDGAMMQTEPTDMSSTGDGVRSVSGITWSGWGSATATGTGTLAVDNCDPDCASGTDTYYPATVTLSGLTPYLSGTEGYDTIVFRAPTYPAQPTVTFRDYGLPTSTHPYAPPTPTGR